MVSIDDIDNGVESDRRATLDVEEACEDYRVQRGRIRFKFDTCFFWGVIPERGRMFQNCRLKVLNLLSSSLQARNPSTYISGWVYGWSI